MSMSFTAPRMEQSEVAREIKDLTEEEKQDVKNDIYGLADPIEETPDFLASSLQRLDDILRALPDEHKIQFLRAQQECPEYVNDPKFRLQFLRTEFFVEEAAASRLCNFWAEKEALFGVEKTYRKLTIDDLTEADLEPAFRDGWMMLPRLDHRGRAIVFSVKPKWSYRHRDNFRRWAWYVLEAVTENESAQKNGLVCLSFDDGPFSIKKFDRKLEAKMYQLATECFPLRLVAVHHCFDSKVYEILIPFMLYMMGPTIRARYRTHPGKKRHLRLEAFEEMGMPPEILPESIGGKVALDINSWIEERRRKGV